MNITVKQYIGGFVGGFLGIVCFHFVGVLSMVLGCCLGFIGGFWFQEIWQKVTAPSYTFEKVLSFLIADWEKTISHWSLFTEWSLKKIKFGNSITEQIIGTIALFFSKLPGWIVRFLCFMARKPRQFVRWFKSHPVNRSLIMSAVITLTWSFICIITAWWLSTNYPIADGVPGNKFTPYDPSAGNSLYWLLAVSLGIIGPLVALAIRHEADKPMKIFYKRYSRWSRSAVNYSFFETIQIIYGSCLITLSVIVFLALLIPAALFMFVSGIMLFGLYTLANILLWFAHFSTKKTSWTGILITLAVTIITALVTKNSMNDATVWIFALLNGNACGIMVVGSHSLIKATFIRYKSLIRFAKSEEGSMVITIDTFEKIISRFWKLITPILMKPLRA